MTFIVAWLLAVFVSVVVLGWWMDHTYQDDRQRLIAKVRALREHNRVLTEMVDEWRTRARTLQAQHHDNAT